MVVPHKSTNMASNHISFNEPRSAEKHIASASEKDWKSQFCTLCSIYKSCCRKNKSPLKTWNTIIKHFDKSFFIASRSHHTSFSVLKPCHLRSPHISVSFKGSSPKTSIPVLTKVFLREGLGWDLEKWHPESASWYMRMLSGTCLQWRL